MKEVFFAYLEEHFFMSTGRVYVKSNDHFKFPTVPLYSTVIFWLFIKEPLIFSLNLHCPLPPLFLVINLVQFRSISFPVERLSCPEPCGALRLNPKASGEPRQENKRNLQSEKLKEVYFDSLRYLLERWSRTQRELTESRPHYRKKHRQRERKCEVGQTQTQLTKTQGKLLWRHYYIYHSFLFSASDSLSFIHVSGCNIWYFFYKDISNKYVLKEIHKMSEWTIVAPSPCGVIFVSKYININSYFKWWLDVEMFVF